MYKGIVEVCSLKRCLKCKQAQIFSNYTLFIQRDIILSWRLSTRKYRICEVEQTAIIAPVLVLSVSYDYIFAKRKGQGVSGSGRLPNPGMLRT